MKVGQDIRFRPAGPMSARTPRMWPARLKTTLASLWRTIQRLGRRAPRRLRLCESLPLGERRFVAVVEFEDARFLVGGTASSMVLLSRLAGAAEHSPVEHAQDEVAKTATSAGIASSPGREETC